MDSFQVQIQKFLKGRSQLPSFIPSHRTPSKTKLSTYERLQQLLQQCILFTSTTKNLIHISGSKHNVCLTKLRRKVYMATAIKTWTITKLFFFKGFNSKFPLISYASPFPRASALLKLLFCHENKVGLCYDTTLFNDAMNDCCSFVRNLSTAQASLINGLY